MSAKEILSLVAAGKLDLDSAAAQLDAIAPKHHGRLSCKVSEKGALSVYGLQRMPVTLYDEQWDRLLDIADERREFKKANAHLFKRKEAKAA
jgi:hypothetical protein